MRNFISIVENYILLESIVQVSPSLFQEVWKECLTMFLWNLRDMTQSRVSEYEIRDECEKRGITLPKAEFINNWSTNRTKTLSIDLSDADSNYGETVFGKQSKIKLTYIYRPIEGYEKAAAAVKTKKRRGIFSLIKSIVVKRDYDIELYVMMNVALDDANFNVQSVETATGTLMRDLDDAIFQFETVIVHELRHIMQAAFLKLNHDKVSDDYHTTDASYVNSDAEFDTLTGDYARIFIGNLKVLKKNNIPIDLEDQFSRFINAKSKLLHNHNDKQRVLIELRLEIERLLKADNELTEYID